MGVFCDKLNLCSTAALDCQTGQNRALIPTRLFNWYLQLYQGSTRFHQIMLEGFHQSDVKNLAVSDSVGLCSGLFQSSRWMCKGHL